MGFRPTGEMIEVRSHARRLYDVGMRMVGEWCNKIPELTMRKWQSWEKQDGFLSWWTDLFPEHALVTIADLRALENEANRALMQAIASGDLQAVNMVIKLMGMQQANQATEETNLDEWFSADADGAWLPPIPEA